MTSEARGASRARPLGALDAACLGVNSIIGSSLFLFPGALAALLGPASIVVFGVVALCLLPVGLCFAECSSRFSGHGGAYLYAREAFGGRAGFAMGWLCWVSSVLAWSAVAVGTSVYLGEFGARFASPAFTKLLAAAVIIGLGILNYRGVKLGARVSNFFTAAKLIPLALLVAACLPKLSAARFAPFWPHGWRPLGPACFLAYFALQGFEVVPAPAGEVERPERTIPLALLGSLVGSALLYVVVQAAALGACPALAGAERPLSLAAQAVFGHAGAAFIAVAAVISMTGFNAGCALGGPRYLTALAEDGQLPRGLAETHPRFGTPARAVLATSAAALAAALLLDFNRLVDFSNIVICAQYIGTCVAVPLLRRGNVPAASFRVPGGWTFPLLGVASTLWLGAQGGLRELGWTLAAMAAGFAARRYWAPEAPAPGSRDPLDLASTAA